ncbi:MAG: P-II family nitrogen regulator [Candidatus Helarchaeota archaeon]
MIRFGTKNYSVEWITKIKLEIFINESHDIDKVLEVIKQNAAKGQPGDGKIFVLPVEDAIRIRTGEKGEKVIQLLFFYFKDFDFSFSFVYIGKEFFGISFFL